jgi:hypothetical protein
MILRDSCITMDYCCQELKYRPGSALRQQFEFEARAPVAPMVGAMTAILAKIWKEIVRDHTGFLIVILKPSMSQGDANR